MGHRTVDYAAVDNIRHNMEVPKNKNLNNRSKIFHLIIQTSLKF